jgi:GNAT superfamily N-acetyltransferase
MPEFTIATADVLRVTDAEISDLLTQVYVEGGFTTAAEAASLFEPAAVRRRGTLIGARETNLGGFAGMVIIVPPDSPARRLIEIAGAEMHLLGVKPAYRRHGLGRLLVNAAADLATRLGCPRMCLWTQVSMMAAQRLYESAGFLHVRDMERNGRRFKVYELSPPAAR